MTASLIVKGALALTTAAIHKAKQGLRMRPPDSGTAGVYATPGQCPLNFMSSTAVRQQYAYYAYQWYTQAAEQLLEAYLIPHCMQAWNCSSHGIVLQKPACVVARHLPLHIVDLHTTPTATQLTQRLIKRATIGADRHKFWGLISIKGPLTRHNGWNMWMNGWGAEHL